MIAGLIVGHHNIGEAILTAIESILGSHKHLSSISNNGLSTGELAEKIKNFASSMNNNGLLIFVDVYGGSCWRAVKMAKVPKSHIVTGINLPMLLSFIQKRESLSFDDLPRVLETDGKRGITCE